jgi:ABC-type phosphate transport system substrate-binding protein
VGVGAYIEWDSQYKYVANQLGFTYTSVYNLTEGLAGYLRGDYDFLGVDAPVSSLSDEYLQVPNVASAMAVVYKISSLPANSTLRLSREVLARIWYLTPLPSRVFYSRFGDPIWSDALCALVYRLGQVTSWNDSAITALNPSLVGHLPEAPIKLAWVPPEQRAVTQVFVRGLASFMEDVDNVTAQALKANATLAYLPPVLAGNASSFPAFISVDGPSIFGYTLTTDNVLTYVNNDSYFITSFLDYGCNVALLRNKASTFCSLSPFFPWPSGTSAVGQFYFGLSLI